MAYVKSVYRIDNCTFLNISLLTTVAVNFHSLSVYYETFSVVVFVEHICCKEIPLMRVYNMFYITHGCFGFLGCCFVTFYTRRAAVEAQSSLHNIKTLPGVCVVCMFAIHLNAFFILYNTCSNHMTDK